MNKVFGILTAVVLLFSVQLAPADMVYMVLEQDATGEASHRAADMTPIGDGIDPVTQFILFNNPADPDTAQLLWEASETPVEWVRTAEEQNYRLVEHAVLPKDSTLEYRIYSRRYGYEFRQHYHTRTPGDEDFGVDPDIMNSLADSEYIVQAHLIVPGRPKQVVSQRINVVEFAGLPDLDTDPGQELSVPVTLEPGKGWTGEQAEPGPVGDPNHPGYPYRAIARWAVVPHQTFKGELTIGVAAFHSYGIDRVEFSVENGPWEAIDEMAENPRTSAEEYFVKIDAGQFADGKVTVRAIAYPKHGKPRVLKDLELFANAGGSMNFPVLELGAGTHHLKNLSTLTPKENGWLTIRPKPGVAKEDCIITQVDRVDRAGNLKLQGVTFRAGSGMGMLLGRASGEGMVWLDDVKVVGNGRSNPTDWLVHLWGKQFYTGCEITKVRNVFAGGGGELFARNIHIHDTYEDVFRAFGYVANVTIDGVDRGDTEYHPDLFEFSQQWTQYQVIFHNVTARKAYAQGVFGGKVQDVAMINCDVDTPGWHAMQFKNTLNNVLFEGTRLNGGALFRDAKPNGVVIRDSLIGWRKPFLPDNWNQAGVTVLEHAHDVNE